MKYAGVFCPVDLGGEDSCDSCPKYKEDCDGEDCFYDDEDIWGRT